jgi:hypothetical protein
MRGYPRPHAKKIELEASRQSRRDTNVHLAGISGTYIRQSTQAVPFSGLYPKSYIHYAMAGSK